MLQDIYLPLGRDLEQIDEDEELQERHHSERDFLGYDKDGAPHWTDEEDPEYPYK